MFVTCSNIEIVISREICLFVGDWMDPLQKCLSIASRYTANEAVNNNVTLITQLKFLY